jgi:hemoglobin-like flavoprotein
MASVNEHLSRDEIRLVQETFDRLWPTARTAELFYTRLFEIAPNIRPMFHKVSEMGKQVDKFTATLAMLIWSLDDKAKLLPAIETLAKQHVLYGVQPAHYTMLGQALMDAGASSGRRVERRNRSRLGQGLWHAVPPYD